MCNALRKAREFGDFSKEEKEEESRQVEEIKMLDDI
jgi:hypothetical protein